MFIQKNPITMVGSINRCWLFTYQTPELEARRFLPAPLEPVMHRGYAFWNVVVCHIEGMRPKYVPKSLGVSYWHVGYRLYVRYPVASGDDIQGLYFVRSDCDSALMSIAGNLMTDFNFHVAPVEVGAIGRDRTRIEIASPNAPATAIIRPHSPTSLRSHSAFDHLEQAARFLKYKPFGISVDRRQTGNIVRIVRDEHAWRARLVDVESAEWSFFADKKVRPEICYEVDPIDYQWNRAYRVRPRTTNAAATRGFSHASRRAQEEF